MITAKQLGVVTAIPKDEVPDPQSLVVRLGLAATPHVLTPRQECTDAVAVVSKYLDYASVAGLQWPCQGASFEDFAGQLFDLMVYMHALKSNGCGLAGGRKIVSALRQKTGLTPTALFEMEALKPKAHMVAGSDAESDYLVKHHNRG